MSIKMKELMLETNESKSTILYYLKEGLLPTPSKPKPNVHLYDESCIEIIKFIKYLQSNFSYTISEIQNIFRDNHLDFDGSFEAIVRSLELISGAKENRWYSTDEVISLSNIEPQELIAYQDKGYIFQRARGFSTKELEMIEVLQRAKSLGLDFGLIESYVVDAKELANRENEIGSTLLKSKEDTHNARYELLFDIILKLKPYIFNMHTVKEHHKLIK